MKIEWDFDELYKFADNLKGFGSGFNPHLKKAIKEISKTLLNHIKGLTPIDETGKLIDGWNGNSFLIKVVNGGYEIELVNTTEYALWVNDGHRVRNRPNGDYLKVHHRVKVPVAHKWQKPKNNYYVFGHFFVERGIVQLTETKQIERILYRELEKWWKSV